MSNPPWVPPELLWRADAEQDFELEWASFSAASADRFSRVTSPKSQGSYSWKVNLVDGDVAYANADPTDGPYGERAELGMANPRTSLTRIYKPRPAQFSLDRLFYRGQTRYVALQIYVPSVGFNTNPGTWQIVTQLKQEGSLGTPIISLNIEGGLWKLYRGVPESSDDGSFVWTGSITTDVWTKFVFGVNFDNDPDVGWLELYGNLTGGSTISELYARTTGATMKDGSFTSHLRLGIYRNPTISGDGTLYFDGVCCATTRALAQAVAFS